MEPSFSPAPLVASRRGRLIFSAGVVLFYFGLQLVTQVLAGHDKPRIAAQLLQWVVQMGLIAASLSVNYSIMTKRRAGALLTFASSALLAGAFGVLCNYLFSVVTAHYPELRALPRPGQIPTPPLTRAMTFGLMMGLLHGGFWAMAFVFPFAAEDARLRALEADRLRAAAEVAHLRAHLEPHFMLNTLNAIAGLVTEDPKKARRLIATLGDLLRDAVRQEERFTVDDEIGWLRRYAELLEARHEGMLAFEWEIEEGVRAAMIPRMLLQPLVENAIKHGALKRGEGGRVIVSVRKEPSRDGGESLLVCEVRDNGPGLGEPREGARGLTVVRTQLKLRDPRGKLRLESTNEGVRSVVELPLSLAERDRSEAAQ